MGIGIGDITAVFVTLAAVGVVFPGLLLTWLLLLPATVERARERVTRTPWQVFFLGAIALLGMGIPLALLNAAAGPLQFIRILSVFALLALVSIGAAGVAAMMGERLRGQGVNVTTPGALVRGAIALEFAMVFPFVGWFIVLPLIAILAFGAALFALLRWTPRDASAAPRAAATANAPALGDARQAT
ncbi:MAG: hypothetical protein HDKAJFGB_01352 [Anaerolineae bacterium]|nr:hypothetical protein [Anaerolineae bacterium]